MHLNNTEFLEQESDKLKSNKNPKLSGNYSRSDAQAQTCKQTKDGESGERGDGQIYSILNQKHTKL